jgi:hypothetical protein
MLSLVQVVEAVVDVDRFRCSMGGRGRSNGEGSDGGGDARQHVCSKAARFDLHPWVQVFSY